jgi:hypothetical protein
LIRRPEKQKGRMRSNFGEFFNEIGQFQTVEADGRVFA